MLWLAISKAGYVYNGQKHSVSAAMTTDEDRLKSLSERIEKLEAVVSELKQILTREKTPGRTQEDSRVSAVLPGSGKRESAKSPKPPALANRNRFRLSEEMYRSDYWLNKIGIGLLLFGVAFLFKYSIDQGWLTPEVRIGFGLALGIYLIITGMRIHSRRRHFSRVLLGGGIAIFYITGFAAFQVFELISQPVAFAFMVLATLLSFALSLKQDESVLSVIGTIGGLGTPFLLYTGADNLPGLVGYTCLVLAGSTAIYYFHNWTLLLWVSVIGGWTVLIIGLNSVLPGSKDVASADQWALQAGIIFNGLAFWLIPVLSEISEMRRSNAAHQNELIAGSSIKPKLTVPLLTVVTPLIAVSLSGQIWSISQTTWGWITMFVAGIFGLALLVLVRLQARETLSYSHAFSCVVLLTISFDLLLDGKELLFVLALEALVLHWLVQRRQLKKLGVLAHILSGLIGIWTFERLVGSHSGEPPILNLDALTDLWVLAAALTVSFLMTSNDERRIYLLYVHVGILIFFLRELSALANGQGYVTIVWGFYAVLLLIVGLRKNVKSVRTAAILTLLLVVGKLFLIDLARLEAIWRILLFLGFGGLFLLLSYYFQSWWKVSIEAGQDP